MHVLPLSINMCFTVQHLYVGPPLTSPITFVQKAALGFETAPESYHVFYNGSIVSCRKKMSNYAALYKKNSTLKEVAGIVWSESFCQLTYRQT